MNLISTLNAGIAAAANGWAEVYIRGTSTRAVVYYDFEASTSDSSGDNIDLDAYGAVEVYVNQLVDVVAKSPDGTVIRSWTDGYSSPNIEVISPAFTGHDYVSGAAAVNEPTTLQAVLDLWETNSGAPDWKVDVGGTGTTLVNAFGATAGLVYNVKSPQFGAVGDGVTNDTAAIAAALLAASLAGGGIVFFPEGTYLITTAIALDNFVSMVGVGAGRSVITVNSATERVFQLTSNVATDAPFVIQGLTFQASQVNTGSQLYLGASSAKVLVRDCVFGGNAASTGYGIEYNAGSCRISIERCWFNIRSASLAAVNGSASAAGANVRVRDCTFVGPSSFAGSFLNLTNTFRASITGCMFDGDTNATSGTHYGISCLSSTSNRCVITGNDFYGGSFTAAVRTLSAGIATVRDNFFVGIAARYSVSAILPSGSYLEMAGTLNTSGSGSSYTIPDGYDAYVLVSTGTVPTIKMPQVYFHGQKLTTLVYNGSAGVWGAIAYPGYGGTANAALATGVTVSSSVVQQFMAAELETPGTVLFRAVGP